MQLSSTLSLLALISRTVSQSSKAPLALPVLLPASIILLPDLATTDMAEMSTSTTTPSSAPTSPTTSILAISTSMSMSMSMPTSSPSISTTTALSTSLTSISTINSIITAASASGSKVLPVLSTTAVVIGNVSISSATVKKTSTTAAGGSTGTGTGSGSGKPATVMGGAVEGGFSVNKMVLLLVTSAVGFLVLA